MLDVDNRISVGNVLAVLASVRSGAMLELFFFETSRSCTLALEYSCFEHMNWSACDTTRLC